MLVPQVRDNLPVRDYKSISVVRVAADQKVCIIVSIELEAS